jgi:hypothetical protein
MGHSNTGDTGRPRADGTLRAGWQGSLAPLRRSHDSDPVGVSLGWTRTFVW